MFPHLSQQIDEESINRERLQQQRNQKKAQQKRYQKNQALFKKNRKQRYWNDFQERRYINFLKQQIKVLSLPKKDRMSIKVDILMSQKVKTRNAPQCHTHHQKMLQKYHSVKAIIQNHLYLFNNGELIELKEALAKYEGENKTIDQILMYSQKSALPQLFISSQKANDPQTFRLNVQAESIDDLIALSDYELDNHYLVSPQLEQIDW